MKKCMLTFQWHFCSVFLFKREIIPVLCFAFVFVLSAPITFKHFLFSIIFIDTIGQKTQHYAFISRLIYDGDEFFVQLFSIGLQSWIYFSIRINAIHIYFFRNIFSPKSFALTSYSISIADSTCFCTQI